MQGDVKFVSKSFDIECTETVDATLDGVPVDDVGSITNFVFKLREDYFNNLCIDLKPPRGPVGRIGQTGLTGVDGFGSGPRGYTGPIGPDSTKLMSIRNVVYEDLSEISETAIVGLELVDRGKGPYFKITTSNKTLSNDEPARRLITSSVGRNVNFTDSGGNCATSNLSSWKVAKIGGDPLPDDVYMLRLSDSQTDSAQTFSAVRLADYLGAVIDKYELDVVELDKRWLKESKVHIERIDSAARAALAELANELTRCESTLAGTEFGITFRRCDPCTPATASARKAAGNNKLGQVSSSGKNWEIVS
jgi:hypothetical protein